MSSISSLTESIKKWVSQHLSDAKSDVLVSELCFLGRRNRADLVLANGSLAAFEVKSSQDRMDRWSAQQKAYLNVFDSVWLCVHHKHLDKAYEMLNPLVGLMVLDNYGGVVVLREAKPNKLQNLEALAELLWRVEIDALLAEVGENPNKNARIAEARKQMLFRVPEARIREAVTQAIKERYSENQISSPSSSEGSVEIEPGNP